MAKRNKKVQALLLAGFLSVSTITGGVLQTKYQYNSSASSSVVQTKQVGTTTANLNMRSSASTKGKILTTLKKGTKVDVIQRQSNGWYKIKANGKTGYVSGSYLKVTSQAVNNTNTSNNSSNTTNNNTNTSTSTAKQVGTTTANLNMRSSASTKGKILTTLKKGTKVDVVQKQSNGWYKIKVNGKTGYVSGSYLKVTSQTVNKPTDNTNNNSNNNNTNTSNSGSSTSKPEVATGISFAEFGNRLTGMGFSSDGFYYENGHQMGGIVVKGSQVTIGLEDNSPQFNSVIKNCFNLLLPTQGNRLYSIVSNPFSNQTFSMDGRTVTIKQYDAGVLITITE